MLSVKPWKPEAVLRLGLGIFICVFLGALLAGLARNLPGAGGQHPLTRILAGALGFQGAALILISRFLREHELGWAEAFGFRNRPGRACWLGGACICLYLPAGMGLLALTVNIMTHLGLKPEAQTAVQLLQEAGGWPAQLLLAAIAIVLAPIAEEIIFRGILYPTIRQAGFPRAAWWGPSLFFAAIHLHLPSFLPLLLLALVLTWLYEQTDNLLAAIAAHSLFNAFNFAMLQFADKFDQWHLPHP
jgi:membrane protease YdiL (CAAX protease family)